MEPTYSAITISGRQIGLTFNSRTVITTYKTYKTSVFQIYDFRPQISYTFRFNLICRISSYWFPTQYEQVGLCNEDDVFVMKYILSLHIIYMKYRLKRVNETQYMYRNFNRISKSKARRQVFVNTFYLYNDYEELHLMAPQADTKFIQKFSSRN